MRRLRIACATLVMVVLAHPLTLDGQTQRAQPGSGPTRRGAALFDAGKLDEAKTVLLPLGNAGNADAAYYLGRIAYEQGDGDASVKWLEKAVKGDSTRSVYHQWLGIAYSVKLRVAGPFEAMTMAQSLKNAFERAVQLDSSNIDAHAGLIQFYLQAPEIAGGSVDKAREHVAVVSRLNQYAGRLHEVSVAENQKDTVAVERMLREMIAAYPDSSAPVVRISLAYSAIKRYDDAFHVIEDRLKKSPNDAALLYQLGRVGAVSGQRLDRAEWALRKYLATPWRRGLPPRAGAHWRLGLVLEAKGDRQGARSEYETAVKLDPKNEGAKASLVKLQ